MIRSFYFVFVFLSIPIFAADADVARKTRVSLDVTQDRFNENLHSLIGSRNLQELELLMPERAFDEENLGEQLGTLIEESTTLHKIRLSIPKGYATCGYHLDSNANKLFQSITKSKKRPLT